MKFLPLFYPIVTPPKCHSDPESIRGKNLKNQLIRFFVQEKQMRFPSLKYGLPVPSTADRAGRR